MSKSTQIKNIKTYKNKLAEIEYLREFLTHRIFKMFAFSLGKLAR